MHDKKIRVWPLLLLSTILCIMRCVQDVFFINSTTGYITSNLYNMIIVVFCVACAVLFFVPVLQKGRSLSLTCEQGDAFIMVAGFVCGMFFFLFSVITVWQNIAVHSFSKMSLLLTAFGVLSAVYFAVMFLSRGVIGKRALLTVLGPICFYAYRMVATFNRLTLNTEVTSYRLLLISSGMTLLFLSFLGRSQFDNTGVIKTLIFGRLAFFFLAASSVCSLMVRLLRRFGTVSVFTEDVSVLMLLADVIMMLYILAILRNIKAERTESLGEIKEEQIEKTDTGGVNKNAEAGQK